MIKITNKIDVDLIKIHAKITHDLEDKEIANYLDWAISSIQSSLSSDPENDLNLNYLEENVEYKKAVILLTIYYYDNRLAFNDKALISNPFSVLSALQKLQSNKRIFKVDDKNE